MPDRNGQPTFNEVLSAAMKKFQDNGFESEEELTHWLQMLRAAAVRSMTPEAEMLKAMRAMYEKIYRAQVEQGAALRRNPGVSQYTLSRIRPELRDELDRRIMASASLIRLNRDEEIEKTMRRFAGWASSQPKGGTKVKAPKEKEDIRKSLRGLPFRERRVLIDQGAKLVSSIQATVALGSGAIAGKWHSHWKQANYDYREDHKERDGEIYLVRDSWAAKSGLVKLAGSLYTDQQTQPAEEPFCRCYYEWIFHLRDMPDKMLTRAGIDALKKVRA